MTKKKYIKGIAVREGVSRNKRNYLASELHKFANTLIGKPILKDHISETDNVVGKITNALSEDNGKIIRYEGWIKDDSLAEKIEDERITEVSIGIISGRTVKEKKDDEIVIPLDMEALEISTTPTPGVRGTSVSFQDENYSEEKLKEIIENYNKKSNLTEFNSGNYTIEKEENGMDKESQTTNDESNLAIIESLKKDLESLKKDNESLENARKEDAISKYTELCKVKSLKVKDLSNANMEMIQFAIETVEEMPEEPKEEPVKEPVEEPKEEPKAEEPEADKPIAEPQSKEVDKSEEPEGEKFAGYVIERVGNGFTFYKGY